VTFVIHAICKLGIYPLGDRDFSRPLIAVCLLLLLIENIQAAEWRFRPLLAVEGTYSDNINLEPDGENDFVTDIRPGFTLNGVGRRFSLDVFYNLQYLHYARNTGSNTFNNFLQLGGNGEVAEDLFFIDLRSSVRLETIDNRANTPNDPIPVSDNVTEVYTFGLSPYLTHRFGSAMEGLARYSFDRVASEVGTDDSSVHTVFLDLNSGDDFQKLTWNAFYDWRREVPDDGDTTTFQRIEASGSYRFNRKVAIVFGTGYEDNDFATSSTQDTTAVTWLAGVRLTPNQRTVVEGGAQDRFFGVAPYSMSSTAAAGRRWLYAIRRTLRARTRSAPVRHSCRSSIRSAIPFWIPIPAKRFRSPSRTRALQTRCWSISNSTVPSLFAASAPTWDSRCLAHAGILN
jgi:hypothetical protein